MTIGTLFSPRQAARSTQRFAGLAVTVVGATGGFGEALVEAFTREGAAVTALAKNHDRLQVLASTWGCRALPMDLQSQETLTRLPAQLGMQDMVVFATGTDVRQPFLHQSLDDMAHQVNVNLLGPMVLTRVLADECMKPHGVIAHIGGFGDGHLALPYYAVDVATRSALASLCQALRREFQLEGRTLTVSYLCPAPADTPAERPFGRLWARMGTPLARVDRVADFVLTAMAASSHTAVMGRQTWWLSKANALCPALVDRLMQGRLGQELKMAFGSPHTDQARKQPGSTNACGK